MGEKGITVIELKEHLEQGMIKGKYSPFDRVLIRHGSTNTAEDIVKIYIASMYSTKAAKVVLIIKTLARNR